jgi:hypothetical protein
LALKFPTIFQLGNVLEGCWKFHSNSNPPQEGVLELEGKDHFQLALESTLKLQLKMTMTMTKDQMKKEILADLQWQLEHKGTGWTSESWYLGHLYDADPAIKKQAIQELIDECEILRTTSTAFISSSAEFRSWRSGMHNPGLWPIENNSTDRAGCPNPAL